MSNVEYRRSKDGIALLSLFKIDRIHYSMLPVRLGRIGRWMFISFSFNQTGRLDSQRRGCPPEPLNPEP
jgi:hypothetical protein